MIYDSSKNYLNNTITLVFDGAEPSRGEIYEFVRRNYGSDTVVSFNVYPEHAGYGGYTNPGTVKVQLAHKENKE